MKYKIVFQNIEGTHDVRFQYPPKGFIDRKFRDFNHFAKDLNLFNQMHSVSLFNIQSSGNKYLLKCKYCEAFMKYVETKQKLLKIAGKPIHIHKQCHPKPISYQQFCKKNRNQNNIDQQSVIRQQIDQEEYRDEDQEIELNSSQNEHQYTSNSQQQVRSGMEEGQKEDSLEQQNCNEIQSPYSIANDEELQQLIYSKQLPFNVIESVDGEYKILTSKDMYISYKLYGDTISFQTDENQRSLSDKTQIGFIIGVDYKAEIVIFAIVLSKKIKKIIPSSIIHFFQQSQGFPSSIVITKCMKSSKPYFDMIKTDNNFEIIDEVQLSPEHHNNFPNFQQGFINDFFEKITKVKYKISDIPKILEQVISRQDKIRNSHIKFTVPSFSKIFKNAKLKQVQESLHYKILQIFLYNYRKSLSLKVLDLSKQIVVCLSQNQRYNVCFKEKQVICDCENNSRFKIPCRHMIAFADYKQRNYLSLFPSRWLCPIEESS